MSGGCPVARMSSGGHRPTSGCSPGVTPLLPPTPCTMHCTVCTMLEQAYYTAISLTHHVTINYKSSHRPMGLKSECSAQCVPGGPKLPAGGGSHISCSRPGGLKDISLDNHPVGLEVWPCLCLSVSVWASVCRSLDPIIALHCPAVSQSVSYWYSCTWLLSPWQLLKFDYDSRTASPLVTPSFLESHKQATKISSKTLT